MGLDILHLVLSVQGDDFGTAKPRNRRDMDGTWI